MMRIYDYIMGKQYEDTPGILWKEKQKIYNEAKEMTPYGLEAYRQLEVYLNNEFYPKGDPSHITSSFWQQAIKKYEEVTEHKILGGLTLDAPATELGRSGAQSNFIRKAKEYQDQSKVAIKTLLSKLSTLHNVSDFLLQNPSIQNFEKLQIQVDSLILLIENVLYQYGFDEAKSIISSPELQTKNFKGGTLNTLEYITAEFNEIANTIGMGPARLGEVFEYALSFINGEVGAYVNMNLDDLLKNFKVGGHNVQRSGTNIDYIFDSSENGNPDGVEWNGNATQITVGGITLDTNFTSPKQGKVDVLLTLPDSGGKSFKVSAKNWEKFSDLHNFGETSIIAAVTRTGPSIGVLEHFLYGLGPYKANANQIQAVHDYAKMCLAIDTILGYSMKNTGYNADTIVINNQAEKRIYVYSGADLLKKIEHNNKNSFSFEGYPKNFQEFAQQKLKQVSKRNWGTYASNQYKALMIKYLSEQRVKILMTGSGY